MHSELPLSTGIPIAYSFVCIVKVPRDFLIYLDASFVCVKVRYRYALYWFNVMVFFSTKFQDAIFCRFCIW